MKEREIIKLAKTIHNSYEGMCNGCLKCPLSCKEGKGYECTDYGAAKYLLENGYREVQETEAVISGVEYSKLLLSARNVIRALVSELEKNQERGAVGYKDTMEAVLSVAKKFGVESEIEGKDKVVL